MLETYFMKKTTNSIFSKENLMFLGLSLEYYDLIIYSLLVVYLHQIFFPLDAPHLALLKTIMIFVVGNFSRILGSIVLGFIYDKFGIKMGLFYSMIFMGLCSLGIGILPAKIIVHPGFNLSIYILIIIRFLQGLIYSVEIPGSIAYAGSTNKTSSFGTIFSFLSFGYILASFSIYLLTVSLNESEILSYGWRIPFIFGCLTSIIGVILRYKFIDYQDSTMSHKNYKFSEILQKHNLISLIEIIKYFYAPALIMVYGIYIFPNTKMMGFEMKDITLINTFAVLYSIFISPIIGKYLNWLENNPILVRSFLVTIFLIAILNLNSSNIISLIVYMFAYQIVLSSYYVQGLFRINKITENLKYKTIISAIGMSLCMILGQITYANINYIFPNKTLPFLIIISLCLPLRLKLKPDNTY